MTRRTTLLAFLMFFAFAVVLQAWHGAYSAEFSGNPDEPAHYVTGVMVRDYLASFPWHPPMPFARDFYDHYPIVAIGHWPPVFYVVQALWMLPFGVSRVSVLLLMAVLSAAAATAAFVFWRARWGALPGAWVALVFLSIPIVQEYGRMVMAEILVTLFMMLAAFAYSRYMETERWRDSMRFGLLASACILTKPNGLALAFVPVIAVIAGRRLDLLKRFSFWLPALIVAVLCAPWYLLTADLAQEGWSASYEPSWLLRQPAAENALNLVRNIGPGMFVLAVVGIVYELRPRTDRQVSPYSAVMAAVIASVWLFHSFVAPVRDARHLIPAIPAMLGLALAALFALAGGVSTSPIQARKVALGFAALIAIGFWFRDTGSHAAALRAETAVQKVLSRTGPSDAVMVSSEGFGEGVFIAELAEKEWRPGHRVVRASKALSSSTWNGSDYRLVFDSARDVDEYLRDKGISVIVLDLTSVRSGRTVPHHRQLLDVVQIPNRWQRLEPGSSSFAVFQAVSP